mgnify:CR=1 FL=1
MVKVKSIPQHGTKGEEIEITPGDKYDFIAVPKNGERPGWHLYRGDESRKIRPVGFEGTRCG